MTRVPVDKRNLAFRVYRIRWVVLLLVALLNNSNTMTWISFAPIANHVDSFYAQPGATNWFSVIFMACTIPIGILAMYAGRKFGMRTAILIAAWANGIGNVIKFGSSFLPPEYRFAVGMTGQGIAALAYPFIMFLPTKVAAAWFPDNQRALATTIGVMSNPLGVLMANVLSPAMVKEPSQVVYMNALTALPAIVVAILASVAITRSEPKIPPTVSASAHQFGFLKGLKKCFTSRDYLVLLVVMGGGIGMFNCLYTVMQQLLCPSGYTNGFVGACAALMITGGVVGAAAAGIYVDRTKFYEQTMKVSMSLAVVFGLIFLQLSLHRDLQVFILIVAFLFGMCGMAGYPVALECAAETTFPVSEATSTGLIVLSGQIQSIIYVAVMTALAKPLQEEYQKYEVCSAGSALDKVAANDMTSSVIAMSIVGVVLVIVLLAFFHPKLRRLEAERGKVLMDKDGNGVKIVSEAGSNEIVLDLREETKPREIKPSS